MALNSELRAGDNSGNILICTYRNLLPKNVFSYLKKICIVNLKNVST